MQSVLWLFTKVAGSSYPQLDEDEDANLACSVHEDTIAEAEIISDPIDSATALFHNQESDLEEPTTADEESHSDLDAPSEPKTPPTWLATDPISKRGLDSGYFSHSHDESASTLLNPLEEFTPSKIKQRSTHIATKEAESGQLAEYLLARRGAKANLADAFSKISEGSRAQAGHCEQPETTATLRGYVDNGVHDDDTSSSTSVLSDLDSEGSTASELSSSLPEGPFPRLLGFDDTLATSDDSTCASKGMIGCDRTARPPFRVSAKCAIPPRETLNAAFEQRDCREILCGSFQGTFWRPYLYQQTSCLQCAVKQLACDQGMPRCSRCRRAGHDFCLVQRELLAEERWKVGNHNAFGSLRIGYTVLARLASDDDETWEAKKALEARLLDYLQERYDQGNWALPLFGSVVGPGRAKLKALAADRRFHVDRIRSGSGRGTAGVWK